MPVIYLDIDGVLIPDRADARSAAPAMTDRLQRLLNTTGAQVVVSSHRRRSFMEVVVTLSAFGLTPDHLLKSASSTPFLAPRDLDDDLSVRGQEIQAHIDAHGIDQFVILDDMPVLAAHADRHVQPQPATGLTDVDIDRAISILSQG